MRSGVRSPSAPQGRQALQGRIRKVDRFTQNDPERQANIAFILIFLGIVAVGALTIWLFYGASF